jgi:hypothetical protein
VALPDPQPGLVVSYSYLWHEEYRQGRIEGIKNRPCAIVLAVVADDGGNTVFVAPITHAKPRDKDAVVEIPPATRARLGLDGERSWVVISEVNHFSWPGVELAAVPGHPGRVDYGFLPPVLYKKIAVLFAGRARARKIAAVRRGS